MRRTLAALAASLLAMLAFAAPAGATDPLVLVGSVTGAPDNDPPGTPECDTWARDTFTRTTTITPTDTELYNIHQEITGTWVSTTDPAIHGTITGFVEYTVSGTPLADPDAVNDDVDLAAVACKSEATSPDTTSTWALRYFETEPAPTKTGISAWEYVYDTACDEPYTENEESAAMGPDVFTEACPEPTETATTEPATTTTAAAPAAPQLAKTGANLGMVIVGGVVLLVIGGVFVAFARRRRNIVP